MPWTDYVCTRFGVDSSSRFSCRARTVTHTDTQTHRRHWLPHRRTGYRNEHERERCSCLRLLLWLIFSRVYDRAGLSVSSTRYVSWNTDRLEACLRACEENAPASHCWVTLYTYVAYRAEHLWLPVVWNQQQMSTTLRDVIGVLAAWYEQVQYYIYSVCRHVTQWCEWCQQRITLVDMTTRHGMWRMRWLNLFECF